MSCCKFSQLIKVVIFLVACHSAQAQTVRKNQFEDLFVWKVSDELKLTEIEEKKFSSILRDTNNKKNQLSNKLDESILKANKDGSEAAIKSSLAVYKKNLENFNKVSIQEYEQLKNLFGPKRMAKYLKLKMELSSKVKSLLTDKSEKKETALPPPKIIEE